MDLASLAGSRMVLLLRQTVVADPNLRWRDVFDPSIAAALSGAISQDRDKSDRTTKRTHNAAVVQSLDIESNLAEILTIDDPVIQAIGLAIFSYINKKATQQVAQSVLQDPMIADNPLLKSTVEHLALNANLLPSLYNMTFAASINAGGEKHILKFKKKYIYIGQALDNDIVIRDELVSKYHMAIHAENGEIHLMRLDEGRVFIDGNEIKDQSVTIGKHNTITFGSMIPNAPTVRLDWNEDIESVEVLNVHPILRLAILAGNASIRRLSHTVLADIAYRSRAERYARGGKPHALLEEETSFLIHQGHIRLFDPETKSFGPGGEFGPGELVGLEDRERSPGAFLEVDSDTALLMHVPSTHEIKASRPRIKSNI